MKIELMIKCPRKSQITDYFQGSEDQGWQGLWTGYKIQLQFQGVRKYLHILSYSGGNERAS